MGINESDEGGGLPWYKRALGSLFANNYQGFAPRADAAGISDKRWLKIGIPLAAAAVLGTVSTILVLENNSTRVKSNYGGRNPPATRQIEPTQGVPGIVLTPYTTPTPYPTATRTVSPSPIATATLPALIQSPSPTSSPVPTAVQTPNIITVPTVAPVQVVPTQGAKPTVLPTSNPFEVICNDCTLEQLGSYEKTGKAAWDYIKDFYGLGNDAAITFTIGNGYSATVRIGGSTGTNGAARLSDFTGYPSNPVLKHETAHATNHARFPDGLPSYLDEGLAMYASGEIDEFVRNGAAGVYAQAKTNTSDKQKFLEARPCTVHGGGYTLFVGMLTDNEVPESNRPTPEKNRIALSLIQDSIKRGQPIRDATRSAYETALGSNLSSVFSVLDTYTNYCSN